MRLACIFIFFFSLIVPVHAEKSGGFEFGTDPKIKQVEPEKPVRIKLKRLKDGSYTWELTGDDADRIIGADRKLRKYLKEK